MKTLRSFFCLAVSAWLAGNLFQAHAQTAAVDGRALKQQELVARGGVDAALTALRKAEAAKAANVGDLRRALSEAESAYRRAVSARVVAEDSAAGGKLDLAAMQRDLAQRESSMRGTLSDYLNNRIPTTTSDDKSAVMAGAEATMRTLRMEQEIVNEAARRAQPVVERNGTRSSATTQRMGELMSRISTTDTNEKNETRTGTQHEVEMWLRDRQRQMDVEEFQRLARNAQIVSPTTGKAVTGTERERMAMNAEKQLSESLAYHARDKTTFWDWWDNSADSRRDLAGQIKGGVEAAPEYQALNYLSAGEDSTAQHYRALAAAVYKSQSDMDQWYTNQYLGQTEADTKRGEMANGVHAWWTTGFGTLARVRDLTGESSNTHVKAKMDDMRRDTDAAASAFMAAANTPDPTRLPQHQRELLQRYGYIQEGPDKKLAYTIPQGRRELGSLTSADMPGASVLDAINMETVAVTAASVALPELAAARVGNIAMRLGAGANTAARLGQVASMATGMAVDAGSQYLTTGKVDPKKMIVDNLLVGAVAGKAGELVSAGTGKLSQMLRAGGRDSALAKNVSHAVTELLGLGTETALQTAYQNAVEGHPGLTQEDFMANLLTGAMGRAMAAAKPGTAAFDAIVSKLPEGPLKQALINDPVLALEERHRSSELAENNRQTWERFMQVTENGKNVDAHTIGEAMRRGDFSWSDLKTVAAEAPEHLRPIQDSINEARKMHYEPVNKEAVETAHRELQQEYHDKLAALDQKGLPQEQLAAEKQKLNDWWADEKQRIHAGELNAGSIGVTSDIDRSWMSDRVRDAAKRIEERETFRGEGDIPGPTSAKAWDMNEYYNVMPFIGDTYGAKKPKLDNLAGARVESKGVDLTHGETMKASGLASAMMHMSPEQRAMFEKTS